LLREGERARVDPLSLSRTGLTAFQMAKPGTILSKLVKQAEQQKLSTSIPWITSVYEKPYEKQFFFPQKDFKESPELEPVDSKSKLHKTLVPCKTLGNWRAGKHIEQRHSQHLIPKKQKLKLNSIDGVESDRQDVGEEEKSAFEQTFMTMNSNLSPSMSMNYSKNNIEVVNQNNFCLPKAVQEEEA